MATCSPQELLTNGSCFLCLSEKELNVAIAQLLCDIASGGAPCFPENLSGVESPLNTVTPDWVGQVYVQDNGVVWQAGSLLGLSWTVICEPNSGGGDGLVFGPDPETATSIDAQIDALLNVFGAGSDYTTISFGNPVTVTDFIDFNSSPVMTSLEFRLLESVGQQVDISGCDALVTFVADSLETVGNYFSIDGSTLLVSVSCASLVSVADEFNLNSTDSLNSINFPVLASVGASLIITGGATITTISFPGLASVGSQLDFESLTLCTTISLPSLVSVAAEIFVSGNPALTSFSAPVWVPTNGTTMNFTDNALNATSVQLILRRCVLAGVTTCTIDLSGGTNAGTASLNAQGQADVATLGAQLTINP